MGRTPFELGAESKEFMTDEEMEDYYEFTTQGRWIGSWEMSNGVSIVLCYSVFALCLTFISTEDVEDLFRRMIHPNQVLRIRAVKALEHVSLEDEEADSRSEFAIRPRTSQAVRSLITLLYPWLDQLPQLPPT